MCVVSMVMDHYRERWQPLVPVQPWPNVVPNTLPGWGPNTADPKELQKLIEGLQAAKAPAISLEEIAEFRKLLDRAREYDKCNNEPECEMAEKRDAILRIAKALGVEISFL